MTRSGCRMQGSPALSSWPTCASVEKAIARSRVLT
jgi:hypothetical protein